jgi:hypothetical protein
MSISQALYVLGCNLDVQFLLSGKEATAVAFYVTSYVITFVVKLGNCLL